jgi:Glycosyl hydrolase family 99
MNTVAKVSVPYAPRRRSHRPAAWFIAVILIALHARASGAQRPNAFEPAQAPTRILAHYMPWYEAKPHSPHWGWHWTMGVFDPEAKSPAKPVIASHYRPTIGPYDSGDPDVIEYHALLMRLAGIDGVILDWYGRADLFDYAGIHRHASAFVEQAEKTGLAIAVCYEDQTIAKLVEGGRLKRSERVEHARSEIDWLSKTWFREPAYLKLNNRPVLLSFGHDGLTDDEWQRVLDGSPGAPLYLSEHSRRAIAAGAFDWPVPQVGPSAQDAFYKEVKGWPAGMAVAFPRFHDIYEQAKVHKSWGTIDDNGGKTFVATLEAALKSGLPFVQISTWNDWGEGTVIEPSVEFGYRDLEIIQDRRRQFIETEFPCRGEDLRLPLRLYQLRKEAKKRAIPAAALDEVAGLLAKRAARAAGERLDQIEKEMPPEP